MKKTNNFKELPGTRELWIKIGDYTLKVLYKKEKWFECIQIDNEPEIFFECDEDMENIYTNHALNALKVYSRISRDGRIDFAGREIVFNWDRYLKDSIIIQTGREDEKDGSYPCQTENFEKEKWLEIMEFFEKSNALFLNFDDFIKGKIDD